ncbi:hypothetical protein PIB30_033653 [Stylosanthes scabra]|uniref:Reverse transcriptase zinc-binding domain-containing protein n=1 Tax=Stylosanthes scabra TaxID=79078 RepID=A0ABU6TDM7_9FABA|nr:hypothetical protein [Stylosanthes scabra]
MKIFIWRSLHEKLSVAALLHHRIPSIAQSCHRCNLDKESMMHCLCLCEKAATVWRESPIEICPNDNIPLTYWDFWRDKAENCRLGLSDAKEMARVATELVDSKNTMELCRKVFMELGIDVVP